MNSEPRGSEGLPEVVASILHFAFSTAHFAFRIAPLWEWRGRMQSETSAGLSFPLCISALNSVLRHTLLAAGRTEAEALRIDGDRFDY